MSKRIFCPSIVFVRKFDTPSYLFGILPIFLYNKVMKKLSYRTFTRIQNGIMGLVILFAILNIINYYAIHNVILTIVSYSGAGVSLALLAASYVYKKLKLKNDGARRPSRHAEKDIMIQDEPAKTQTVLTKNRKEDGKISSDEKNKG